MNEWISQSAYFSVVLTLGVYFIGCAIQKKIKAFNPFLFSVVVIVVLLAVFHIDYQIYYDGNEILNFLLTPATVCLAIPLYQQLPTGMLFLLESPPVLWQIWSVFCCLHCCLDCHIITTSLYFPNRLLQPLQSASQRSWAV